MKSVRIYVFVIGFQIFSLRCIKIYVKYFTHDCVEKERLFIKIVEDYGCNHVYSAVESADVTEHRKEIIYLS